MNPSVIEASKTLLLYSLMAILGTSVGWMSGPKPIQKLEAASEASLIQDDWAALPCPSEAEFLKLASQVHLETLEGASLDTKCDDGQKAKVAKALLLMTRLRLRFPGNWPEQLRDDLSHPFDYLAKNTSTLRLDLNQRTTVAYNKIAERAIFLGGFFFKSSPLDGIATLMHEARHSVATEPGHTTCLAGSTPRSGGGCDATFSFDPQTTGAYSFEALFDIGLALYSEGLAESVRQTRLIKAITSLATNFNEIPPSLGRRVDVVAMLGSDKKIRLLHPYADFLVTLDIAFPNPDEWPVRIDLSPIQSGIQILTNQGHVWVWTRRRGLKRRLPEALTDDVQIVDFAPVIVPFQGRSSPVLRTGDGAMKYVEFSPSEERFALFPYPLNLGRPVKSMPEIRRMFLALVDETVFLSKDGGLFFGPHFMTEDVFGRIASLQSSSRWIAGTGGVIYDSLFLIDAAGRLQSVDIKANQTIGENEPPYLYSLKSVNFAARHALKKFAQGLKLQAGLTRRNELILWSRDREPLKRVVRFPENLQIEDMALVQEVETYKLPSQVDIADRQAVARFASACEIESSALLPDPWLGRGLGTNARGELIVAGESEGSCVNLGVRRRKDRLPYVSPRE